MYCVVVESHEPLAGVTENEAVALVEVAVFKRYLPSE
jgi:hypothetical protein